MWQVGQYRNFLDARRELLASKINEFRATLITESEEVCHRSVAELIKLGESMVLEFKSTFQWDVVQQRQNKQLRYVVLKTIAAFMNCEGGTLVIGVEDNGNVYGLSYDLKLLGGSRDRFEQTIMNLVIEKIGPVVAPYIRVRFEDIKDRTVCAVTAEPVRDGVFVKTSVGKEFFIRVGNTTRSLDPEQTHEYLNRD